MAEQERTEAKRDRPRPAYRRRLPPHLGHIAAWWFPFLAILGLATLAYLLSFWLDILTAAAGSDEAETPMDALASALLFQDVMQARNTLGGLGEVMAAVLGLALTVSSIIVQLAATRFAPQVTSLFFRARTNRFIIGFFVTSSVYVLWVNFSLGESYFPRWGVLFSMLAMTASLLLLFPYFAYVFDFMDPEKIVGRIMEGGLEATMPTTATDVDLRQTRALEAVDHLANLGLNALQHKDKGIASDAIDALCDFAIEYGQRKHAQEPSWFHPAEWVQQSPDFVGLDSEALHDLVQRHTWLEWKILRQYQMLFADGMGPIKDTCYLIAIDTRRLGEAAADRGDLHTLDLSIKFFNTYLRAAINACDIRTTYNVLHQYRQLAEFALCSPDHILQERSLQIAKFMRYYSTASFERGMAFGSEVIAHDIGQLCELAFRRDAPGHAELLQVFLAVDQHAETKEQEKTLRGVRRAQVKLATTYLHQGAIAFAEQIRRDMAEEPKERLLGIWQELLELHTREFWEVNDRGTNFDYLAPEPKAQLGVFFGWFGLTAYDTDQTRTSSDPAK